MDIAVTWNLLLSAVAFPALAFFIKRELNRTHEELKDNQKELKDEIRNLRGCMGSLKSEVHNRVHKDDCAESTKEKWDRLHHHKHDADGRVVIP